MMHGPINLRTVAKFVTTKIMDGYVAVTDLVTKSPHHFVTGHRLMLPRELDNH